MTNNVRNKSDDRAKLIQELKKSADKIRRQKERVHPRRPIVIEFCGSPKAGKSSCINSLSMFLRRNKIRNLVITERGSICPIRNKLDPYFNVWAGCSALAKFAEIMTNEPKDYDVVILDRGFFDSVCWFYWQTTLSELDEPHYRRFVNFFLSPKWTRKVSILYIFKVDPKISLEREHAHLLTDDHGSIMNPEVLEGFNRAVEHCEKEHGVHFATKIRRIDTSTKTQDKVNLEVTQEILSTLENMIKEKVAYFDSDALSQIRDEVFDPQNVFEKIKQLSFGERNWVESQSGTVQPIPVAVITDPEMKRIVIAKKLKSATSKDSPERRRDLVYFGGHVREEDEWDVSGLDSVSRVLGEALSRELKEELDIDYVCREKPVLCIWDRSNERSAKHVAFVYHVKLNLRSLRVVADRKEFAERGAYVTELHKISSKGRDFERWSELILERVIKLELHKSA